MACPALANVSLFLGLSLALRLKIIDQKKVCLAAWQIFIVLCYQEGDKFNYFLDSIQFSVLPLVSSNWLLKFLQRKLPLKPKFSFWLTISMPAAFLANIQAT